MADTATLEIVYQIWDDSCGERIDVSDDADGLGLTTMYYVDHEGHKGSRITVTDKQLPLLIEALQRRLEDQKKRFP